MIRLLFHFALLFPGSLLAQTALLEPFNTCHLPTGWTSNLLSGEQSWQFGPGLGSPDEPSRLDGTCLAYWQALASGSSATSSEAELLSPVLDLSSVEPVLLEFDYNLGNNPLSSGDGLVVEAWDGTSWVEVFSRIDADACGSWDCGPPFPRARINVTALAHAGFQVRFRYRSGAGGQGFVALDNIRIARPLSQDLGVSALWQPAEKACLPEAAESVQVAITNYGINPVAACVLCFQVEGPLPAAPVCEVLAGTLPAPGTTQLYTFLAPADLRAAGTHILTAYTVLSADGDPGNDSSTRSATRLPLLSIPLNEDFETYAYGTRNFSTGLLNSLNDQGQWEVWGGSSPVALSGPESAPGAGRKYLYSRWPDPSAGHRAVLESACLDLSTALDPSLAFSYHMFGASMDSLVLDVVSPGGTVPALILDKQQQSASSEPWLDTLLDLSSWAGQQVWFRWKGYLRNAPDGSGAGQNAMALDRIRIRNPLPGDAGVQAFFSPMSSCSPDSQALVSVLVANYGGTPISGLDLSYRIAGQPAVTESSGAAVLPPFGTALYTFSTPADLSGIGAYSMRAWTEQASDPQPANDRLDWDVQVSSPVAAFPYIQHFDAFTACASSCGSCADNTSGGWVQEADDDIDWAVSEGPSTPTPGTGPSAGDHTSGSGRFLFLEASGCSNRSAGLISPCLDLGPLSCPQLNFWYHMLGSDMGELRLQIKPEGGTWTELWSASGDQGNRWRGATLSLQAYAGQIVAFRFLGSTGNGEASDMAIDDFSVFESGPDVGVQALNAPLPACSLGLETLSLELVNTSCLNAPAFEVVLLRDGEEVLSETVAAGLAGLSSLTYNLTSPVDLSAPLSRLMAYTRLPGDVFSANDTALAQTRSLEPVLAGTGFAGQYCQRAGLVLPEPTYPQGIWQGGGIVDSLSGAFDPNLIAPGDSSLITYVFFPQEGYVVQNIPYAPLLPADPVSLSLGDDDFVRVPIGFDFLFYGQSYEHLFIGSNGLLSFGQGVSSPLAQALPDADAPNNLIALHWNDLDPEAGGSISYAAEGEAPFRRLIISYVNVPHRSDTELKNSMQLILYESTQAIEMHLGQISESGVPGTQGMENADGSLGINSRPGTNAQPFSMSLEAFRYLPAFCGGVVAQYIRVLDRDTTLRLELEVTRALSSSVPNGKIEASVSGGTPPYRYQWSDGQSTATASGLLPGVYELLLEDAALCAIDTSAVVDVRTGLENPASAIALEAYPNPGSGQFTLRLQLPSPAPYRISLHNPQGVMIRELLSGWDQGGTWPLDLLELPAGLYWISLLSAETSASRPLLLQR